MFSIEMSTNHLIKTLFKQKHEIFVKLIDLVYILKKLIIKKKLKKNQLIILINQKKSVIFLIEKWKFEKRNFDDQIQYYENFQITKICVLKKCDEKIIKFFKLYKLY